MNSMACRIVLGRTPLRTLCWSQAKDYAAKRQPHDSGYTPGTHTEVLTGPPINNLVV